jgi:phosphomannomutase/phosphoglucomutase
LSSDAALGIGFDGDCDRMAPMTKSGRLVKGDQLLTIFSKQILEQYPGSAIVFDISSSRVLHQVVKQWGGIPLISSTGIAQVKKKMAETNSKLGGEISCHTIFKDRYLGFDDGIYSMMRLFELLQKTSKSLDELLADFPPSFSSPTYRIPCDKVLCQKIIETIQEHFSPRGDAELMTIDGLRVNLPYGWAIVRQSKTEPVISMRFEGDTEEDLKRIKSEFYLLINSYLTSHGFLLSIAAS